MNDKLDNILFPSKELLSVVIDEEVISINKLINGNELSYDYKFKPFESNNYEYDNDSINIYELIQKMKEWAIMQDYGYVIHSHISGTFGHARVEWYEKNHSDKHGQYRELTFYSEWFEGKNNSEFEAIVQACEWILSKLRIKVD
jgi:hypothetical protein